MTLRALFLALSGIFVICTFGFFNDFVLKQTYMVGTFMPIPVYGGLILFLLLVNPLLKWLGTRWLLTNQELAVAVGIILFACFIPGRGLMHHATGAMMLPHHYAKTNTAWREAKALEMVPEKFLADISENEDKSLTGFVQGAEGKTRVGLREIPWSSWARPFLFWGPLLLTMAIALTGLALVVHRQWTTHEQIPYPIVTFAESLLPKQGRALGGVFQEPMFWLGSLVVLAIYLNNYAVVWWPDNVVGIRLDFDFRPLCRIFPTFARGGGWGLLHRRLLFTVVGFAYFLSTDVSLSMGLAPYLYTYFNGLCMGYGIRLAGTNFFALENIERNLYGGAYLGLGMAMLYTGRRYYASVCRRCFGFKDRDNPEASAVWGARIMLLASAAFIAQLVGVGIDWQLATLYTFLFLLISVVLSRVVAETGAFFIHCYFYPCALLVSFLGAQAFDPKTMATLFFITMILMIDPREIFMPFAIHAFALMDRTKVRLGKPAVAGLAAVVIGLAVAATATLYWQYNEGATAVGDGWSLNVMRWPFDNGAKLQQRLEALGRIGEGVSEANGSPTGFARFTQAIPHRAGMVAFFSSVGLVLLFSFCRMRFKSFPLHPIIFLVLGSYQSKYLGFSFLIGWLIKRSVVKYGGAHLYAKLKPLMIGIIAGEMMAGVITMLIGAIYYFVTKEPPKRFVILGA